MTLRGKFQSYRHARRRRTWGAAAPRRTERGAVAVEAAIITPLLVALAFGIIEFGLLLKDDLGVTSSVRAGARMASAEPRAATFAQDAANQVAREGSALDMTKVRALWVYKADPAYISTRGTPLGGSGTFNACSACVKFVWSPWAKKFVVSGTPSWTPTQQNACSGDVNRDSVGVYLKYDHPAVTNLFFRQFTLTSHTVMSLEPIPSSSPCK